MGSEALALLGQALTLTTVAREHRLVFAPAATPGRVQQVQAE